MRWRWMALVIIFGVAHLCTSELLSSENRKKIRDRRMIEESINELDYDGFPVYEDYDGDGDGGEYGDGESEDGEEIYDGEEGEVYGDYYDYEYEASIRRDKNDINSKNDNNIEELEDEDPSRLEEVVETTIAPDIVDQEHSGKEKEVEEISRNEESEDYNNQNDNDSDNGEILNEDANEDGSADYEDEQENEDQENYDYNEEESNDEESNDDSDDEYVDEDTETLYKNYEILSNFYQKHFVDLRTLDNTCDPSRHPAPEIAYGHLVKYRESQNLLMAGTTYSEAEYRCDAGYKMSTRTSNKLFCQELNWIGLNPECEPIKGQMIEYPDYSEESEDADDCGDQHDCEQECRLDDDGYPECYCSTGYTMDQFEQCIDVDECEEDNGGCTGTCDNKPGSYVCSCPAGYDVGEDEHSCVDINECTANNGHGPCQDKCINEDGHYSCSCDDLPGTQLSDDGINCEDVNLCHKDNNNGGCSHTCYSSYGQSFCMCPEGFELGDDWKTCRDINECLNQEENGVDCDGTCENMVGSYRCTPNCEEGYMLKNDVCVPRCKDGYILAENRCVLHCEEGYILEGDVCVKECEEGYFLEYDVCVKECEEGYILEDDVCVEECEEGYVLENDVCVEDCEEGYTLVDNVCVLDCEEGYILDDDNCILDCEDGYEPRDDICVPICGLGFKLTNNECVRECKEGYSLDSNDRCITESKCNELTCQNGRCVDSQCHCNSGYELSGGVCADIDECQQDPGLCHPGTCVNTAGSFACQCRVGYREQDGQCWDIDECEEGTSGCTGLCFNQPGGYQCQCREGYTLESDNHGCKDIDECRLQPAICHHSCKNLPGSFQCVCNAGYQVHKADDTKCVPQKTPTCKAMEEQSGGNLVCNNELVNGRFSLGTVCRLECKANYTRHMKFRKKCTNAGIWEGSDGRCILAECPVLEQPENAQLMPPDCRNRQQHYKKRCRFVCDQGFRLSGSRSAICGKHSKWIFRNGFPSCVAPPPRPSPPPRPLPPSNQINIIPSSPSPYIICPEHITANMTQGRKHLVSIPKPQTNMEWTQVSSKPVWAMDLIGELPPGIVNVKFQAKNPHSGEVAECQFKIIVRDAMAPTINKCPQSFTVFLDKGQRRKKVNWEEPMFEDNIEIAHVMTTKLPGNALGPGKHLVIYEASDAFGNKERCAFTIRVKRPVDQLANANGKKWVLCRVGNTGRQVRLFVKIIPPGCREM